MYTWSRDSDRINVFKDNFDGGLYRKCPWHKSVLHDNGKLFTQRIRVATVTNGIKSRKNAPDYIVYSSCGIDLRVTCPFRFRFWK